MTVIKWSSYNKNRVADGTPGRDGAGGAAVAAERRKWTGDCWTGSDRFTGGLSAIRQLLSLCLYCRHHCRLFLPPLCR